MAVGVELSQANFLVTDDGQPELAVVDQEGTRIAQQAESHPLASMVNGIRVARLIKHAKLGRPQAMDEICEAVEPFVAYMANKKFSELSHQEKVQAGMLRVPGVALRYNPEAAKLSTYLGGNVIGAIKDEERAQDRLTRKQRSLVRGISRDRAANKQDEANKKLAELQEEAPILVRHGEVVYPEISLDGLAESSGYGENVNGLGGMLTSSLESTERSVFSGLDIAEIKASVRKLTARERFVVYLTDLFSLTVDSPGYKPKTAVEIGAILGVDESRVSQIKTKALTKVRADLQSTNISI